MLSKFRGQGQAGFVRLDLRQKRCQPTQHALHRSLGHRSLPTLMRSRELRSQNSSFDQIDDGLDHVLSKETQDDCVQEIARREESSMAIQVLHHFQDAVVSESNPCILLPCLYYLQLSADHLACIVEAFVSKSPHGCEQL